jgi:hypothetical protein
VKKIKLLPLAFILITTLGFSQTKELIYIRIQEKFGGAAYDSYMQITFPNQTSKLIELKKLGFGGSGAEENGKIIQKEIADLLNQGYDLTSSSTGSNDGITTTTLFLIRKKEK